MTEPDRPAQRPEGRLIQTLARGRSAATFASEAGISPTRWRHIVNGYQPMGAGQSLVVIAPAATLARMAEAVGATPEQLDDAGRSDAADELRTQLELGRPRHGIDTPPLPAELDELIARWVAAEEDDREVIVGQVRWLLRALGASARERR